MEIPIWVLRAVKEKSSPSIDARKAVLIKLCHKDGYGQKATIIDVPQQ